MPAISIADPRCLLVGEESLVVQCSVMLRAADVTVAGIVSAAADVRSMAADEGFEVFAAADVSLAEAVGSTGANVLISAAHLDLVPAAALEAVDLAVNFHDGPLPHYAGLNVTTWAIHNGETDHAVNWHIMEAAADTGEILATRSFAIGSDDTAFSLNARCYENGVDGFADVVAMLAAGEVVTSPQSPSGRRLFRRVDRPVLVVDPSRPARVQLQTARSLDVGARVANPVGVPRLVIGDVAYSVELADGGVTSEPAGRIVRADDVFRVATVDGALDLTAITDLQTGKPVPAGELLSRHELHIGAALPAPAVGPEHLEAADRRLAAAERGWADALAGYEPSEPALLDGAPSGSGRATISAPGIDADAAIAAVARWLAAVSPDQVVGFEVIDADARREVDDLHGLGRYPLVSTSVSDAVADTHAALARGPFLPDLPVRVPATRGHNLEAVVRLDLSGAATDDGPALTFVVGSDAIEVVTHADGATAARIAAQLQIAVSDPVATSFVSDDDREILGALNDVVRAPEAATVDALFRARAETQPDAPAVTSHGVTSTYGELASRVAEIVTALREVGVSPGDLVGIALRRSTDMVATALAIQSCGAAYVPLDPTYPTNRIEFMVEDADLQVVVIERNSTLDLSGRSLTLLHPEEIDAPAADPVDHGADDLAYVIYTSGSTGLPKGVQLEHRNVVNFFNAMDEVIDADPSGVWLAVTSLSFDISVLELLWTLTRGLHVIVKAESGIAPAAASAPRKAAAFSLFYFGAGEAIADDGYHFIRESVTWADRNGFEAAWFPERHFHEFGAPYPNPSVIGSAVAALTENLKIRAGSVVLPLHNPVRVAEEWAVVDNLSNGRVGVSVAPGWQVNDFVLNPGAHATARADLAKNIDTVKRLWRGETVALPGPRGDVDVHTFPRPIQDELPMWMTSAGSRGTFEQAGELGMNILTHLLGQSVDDLKANIDAYRAAWTAAGHAGSGQVTVMVHTYLDEDADIARQIAREPLKGYLGTAAGLLKNIASEFPTFRGSGADADEAFRNLTDEEMGMLLDMAADRYLHGSGLFGTVEEGVDMAAALTAAGVDEIGCLIDFGVSADEALGALDRIAAVRDGLARVAADTAPDIPIETVSSLIRHHGVTHFQCTPSLAEMLVADPGEHDAIRSLAHVMLGGEAMPVELARQLRSMREGRFTNMYGPTETTIWSLVHEVAEVGDGAIPIGRPILNNPISIRDESGAEMPVGTWGELHIGGEGVARGYRDRPELTAERFVERDGGRTYGTGDVARVHPSGQWVEFGGRGDGQVKIRGHRIELGEIEAVIDSIPGVAKSVVATPPDQPSSLIAFVVPTDGAIEPAAVIDGVAARLPDAMVPSSVRSIDALPLTPNGKVDRKALPFGGAGGEAAPVADDLEGNESVVASVWAAVLGHGAGLDDNFFDIGGHSLRAVAVFRSIVDRTGATIALTDVFRFPTIRSLASHLDSLSGDSPSDGGSADAELATAGTDRGARRREARRRRG